MARRNPLGKQTIKREIEIVLSILVLFGVIVSLIFVGISGVRLNFDPRKEAAGKIITVENNQNLQEAINQASDSDAILLKTGTYSPIDTNGFSIQNKNIRILGNGKEYVNVIGNNKSYVFNVQNSNVEFNGIKISGANKDGILINNPGGTKEILIKDVEISSNSGAAINTNTKTSVFNSILNQNGTGIETTNEINIQNSIIQNSASHGVRIAAGSSANSSIKNVIFLNNKAKGLFIEGGNTHTIKNISAFNNEGGIVKTGASSVNIANTIVQGSKSEGISLAGTNSSVSYTNSFNNAKGNYIPESLKNGEGNLSVESSFVSESDLHLSAASALIDKGNNSEKDLDGSRSDIGAYAGSADLVAANGAPTVEAVAPKYLKPGEAYSYEIKATDPDKDTLSYIVLNKNAPQWVKLNGNKLTGTPSANDIGFGGLLVLVTDKRGHNIVHPVSINVIPADRVIPTDPVPTTIPTTTVAPTSTPGTPAPVAKIEFVSPKKGTTLTNTSNEIKWNVTNGQNLEKVVLKYSVDNEEFKLITTLPGDRTSHNWDLKDIPSGPYILLLEATEKGNGVTIKQYSESFEVKTTPQAPQGEIIISKISPPDNQPVETRRPSINVQFSPEADIDLEKTYLKINGENVKFDSSRSTIFHTPTTDISGNKARLEVKIVTKDGRESAARVWSITLPANIQPQAPETPAAPRTTVLGLPKALGLTLIALLILGLVLLILYFISKLIKTIREERQGNLEAEFTEYYGPEDYDPHASAVSPAVIKEETITQTVQNAPTQDYLVPQGTTNEYHIDETMHAATLPAVASPVYTETTTTQEIVPSTNKVVTTESTTIEQSNTPAQPEFTDYMSEPYTTQTTTNTTVSANNDVSTSTTTTESTQTSQVVENQEVDDPYIQELRQKYGITDESIDEYKKQEESQVTLADGSTLTETKTTNIDTTSNPNDLNLPDPSQASKPPKKIS